MTDLTSLHAVVYGRVQGVFFRASASRHARKLGLTGYVCNLPDVKVVEVQAEGERYKLEKLVQFLRVGTPGAKVEKVITNWSEYTGSYTNFNTRY